MNKYLCFRFDVDTHVCIREGMVNILTLFKLHDARCTFFVNMGTAFDRHLYLKEKLSQLFSKKMHQKDTLPMFFKLGLRRSLEAMVFNPKVGFTYPKILSAAILDGHELGLHGGRNHAQWETNALDWDRQRISKEIEYGCTLFKKLKLPDPISFASPCWQSPNALIEILPQFGFSILADRHSDDGAPQREGLGLLSFPTNIMGKQAKVGFIENFRALGYSSEQILSEFEKQLDREGNHKMVFDHPFYAGIKELEILSQMIVLAKHKGYKIESLKTIHKFI